MFTICTARTHISDTPHQLLSGNKTESQKNLLVKLGFDLALQTGLQEPLRLHLALHTGLQSFVGLSWDENFIPGKSTSETWFHLALQTGLQEPLRLIVLSNAFLEVGCFGNTPFLCTTW